MMRLIINLNDELLNIEFASNLTFLKRTKFKNKIALKRFESITCFNNNDGEVEYQFYFN